MSAQFSYGDRVRVTGRAQDCERVFESFDTTITAVWSHVGLVAIQDGPFTATVKFDALTLIHKNRPTRFKEYGL